MALVSILGLGALLLASGLVFTIIKWIGIIYLLFIGFKLIVEPVKTAISGNNNDKPASIIRKGNTTQIIKNHDFNQGGLIKSKLKHFDFGVGIRTD